VAKYNVALHSSPSPGSCYYNGNVLVVANSRDEAALAAKTKLKRGAFADRAFSSWIIDSIEEVL
jgi:hypothetical protein